MHNPPSSDLSCFQPIFPQTNQCLNPQVKLQTKGEAGRPERTFSTIFYCGVLLLNLFSSTTITLMLSPLPRDMASSARNAAASEAELPLIACGKILAARPVRHCLVILHATSLEMTSHSPSLASMMNSSLSVRLVTVTSGSEVTNGLR